MASYDRFIISSGIFIACNHKCVGLDPLNTEIVSSNPARGMDGCTRFSVSCCPA